MTSDDDKQDMTQPFALLAPGRRILHYEIVRKLGEGGMGEVYSARDTKLDRVVALKFLPAKSSQDPDAKARLIREARAAAKLNHPNIVSTFAIEEALGRVFIAMEYVDGKTLRDITKDEELPIDSIINITCQILQGLEAAHAKGIIHRDIKSGNIMLTSSSQVKITDFGLARLREVPDITKPGMTVGTMSYMAPEQIQNQPVDQRSDIFSLGVVLYELATRKLPFEGDYEASIIYAVINQDPQPLTILRPDIPEILQKVILKMLQKNISQRYQNIREAMTDLSKVTGQCLTAPKGKSVRAKRAIAASLIGVVFLVAGFFLFPRLFSPSHKKMVAVLPFRNLGQPEDEYFADGITDEITTDLSKLSRLGVISRTSTVQYKDSKKSIRQIARELGVDYILEGSVLWDKSGNISRIRINPQLIRTSDDTHIWAETYERILNQVIPLQTEIAEKAALAMNIAILGSERKLLAAVPTSNLQAYDIYLQGNYYYHRSWGKNDLDKAIETYQRAITFDPRFAQAYSMLGQAHSRMYWEYYDRNPERLSQAKAAVDKALEIDPELPDAHLALGMFYYSIYEFDSAMKEFEIVRRQQPASADLLTAEAGLFRRRGAFRDAATTYAEALALDPRSHLDACDVGMTYSMLRMYPEAENYLDQAIALMPSWPFPYIYKAWVYIFWKGDRQAASQTLEKAAAITDLSRSEYYEYYWWLATILDDDPYKTLSRISPGQDTVTYYIYLARIYRLLNNREMEYAYSDSARMRDEPYVLAHPDDPRYLEKMGLALAGLGRVDDAIRYGKRAEELLPLTRDAFNGQFIAESMAEIYVMTGKYDSAIDQLELLLSVPGFTSIPYLRLDPVWTPLRTIPRFQSLVGKTSPVAAN